MPYLLTNATAGRFVGTSFVILRLRRVSVTNLPWTLTRCLTLTLTCRRQLVLAVEEDAVVRQVRVPQVVVRRLVVPDELTGVDVQRDDRVGVEVLARAARVPRHRVARAEDREVELRVDERGLPHRAAAVVRVGRRDHVLPPGGPCAGTIAPRPELRGRCSRRRRACRSSAAAVAAASRR